MNGINNDEFEAYRSMVAAKSAVSSSLALTPGAPAPECVAFRLAYNDTQGFLLDLIDAARQRLIELPVQQVYRWLASYDPAPDWFQQAFANKIAAWNDAEYVSDPVLQNVVGFALEEVRNCNRVVLLSHSQGNFYANSAYGILSNPAGFVPPDSVDIVAAATPSSKVAGDPTNSRYTTLHGDIINLVFGARPPNATSPSCPAFPIPNIVGAIACHSFASSYMQGVTRLRVADQIIEQLSKPKICPVLKVSKIGTGTGRIFSPPDTSVFPPRRIDCGSVCEVPVPLDTVVQLTAAADATYRFEEWTLDCTGTVETTSVTMSSDRTCTAKFGPANVLTITKTGSGTGTVSSAPVGISCGPSCPSQSASFTGMVQLTATAATDSTFAGWSGACSGTAVRISVDVNSNKTCTAKFDQPILTVTKAGGGSGTVTSVPTGINCGPACTTQNAPFPASPPVQLTAMAASGSSFTGWGGDCVSAGMNTTAQVTLTSDKSCTAIFEGSLPAVRLNPFGNQNGTVPYSVQVVNPTVMVTPAPGDITVTLLREVFSECSGLLFSSNRAVVVPQGQSSAGFNFDAGHDPNCNTLPITTVYTVTKAVLAPGTVLDLSGVPPQQLMLFSIH